MVERVKGERVYKEYPSRFVFYYDDKKGQYQTIMKTPVSIFETTNSKTFYNELKSRGSAKLWEKDVNPVFRCLSERYEKAEVPKLNVAFFDIETDFDPEMGFAPTDDPFNKVTAITIYLQWLDRLVTLAVPPKTLTMERAQEIAEKFDDTFVFTDEKDMLLMFLDLIDDADVLSGWNSEGFDIPYMVNRITRVINKERTRRLCLWGQLPKQKEYEKYGKVSITYELIGRIHMDYMNLYQKFTYEERHSYSLDAIAEYELKDRKTPYEGSLDQLYNNDFEKFLAYNRQDVALLGRLDAKLKFMDLANVLAHDSTVLIQTTLGSVAMIEQAIINEAHGRGMIVPSRKEEKESSQAAGAYVVHPVKGMHKWIGTIDINSLYPSCIRALNMGPETIVGQLRQTATDQMIEERMASGTSFAEAWEGLFGSLEYTSVIEQKRGTKVIIDWEDGSHTEHNAADVWDMIFASGQPLVMSANGTIFNVADEGIIPGLLRRWYAERKQMQAKLKEAIDAGDKELEEFYDKRQLVKKILLNS